MRHKVYASILCACTLFTAISGLGFDQNSKVEEKIKTNTGYKLFEENGATYEIPNQTYDNGFRWINLNLSDLEYSLNDTNDEISIDGLTIPTWYRDINVILPATIKVDFTVDGGAEDVRTLPVTKIGEESFLRYSDCETSSAVPGPEWSRLRGVTIPSSVKSIGRRAFYCNNLSVIDIPEDSELTSIGSSAFFFNYLTQVKLPVGVTSIGTMAFQRNAISYLTTPMTTNVDKTAFTEQTTSKFERVTINGGNVIPSGMFDGRPIGQLVLEEGITEIQNTAFRNTGLTELDLPTTITTLGTSAFNQNSIKKLTAGGNIINNFALDTINKSIEWLVVKEGTEDITKAYIGSSSDYSKPGMLKKLDLPETLKTIATSAFENNQIKELIIPDNVTTLGTKAFLQNPINNLTIGKVVNGITNMEAIIKHTDATDMLNTLTLSEGVTTIATGLFRGSQRLVNECTSEEANDQPGTSGYKIVNLTLPSSITTIKQSAFRENQISSIVLHDNITLIEKWAFNCNKISYFESGTYTQNLRRNMYAQNRIAEVYLREGATSVWESAFERFVITKLTIPNSLTSIGNSSFLRNRLTEVEFGTGLISVGNDAFARNRITSITLNEGLQTIGDSAFKTNAIRDLTIPSSVTLIGAYSFAFNEIGVDGSELNIKASLTNIPVGAFLFNDLKTAVIPASVTSIERLAFSWNQELHMMYFVGNAAIGFDQLGKILDPYHKTLIGPNSYRLNYVIPTPQPIPPRPPFANDPVYEGVINIIEDIINTEVSPILVSAIGFIIIAVPVFAIRRKVRKN